MTLDRRIRRVEGALNSMYAQRAQEPSAAVAALATLAHTEDRLKAGSALAELRTIWTRHPGVRTFGELVEIDERADALMIELNALLERHEGVPDDEH